MFKKKPKTKELRIAFTLSQLEEMRTKLKDALDNVDFDGFASVDDESGELHMTFTLEEDGRELKVVDREYHKEPTNLLRAYDVDKKAERTFDMKFLVPLLHHETKPRSKDFNEKLYEKYIDSYEEMTGNFALEVLKEDHNGEPLESGSPTTDFAMFLINELELWQQMYYNDSEQNGYKLGDNYAALGNFEL